MPADLHRIEHMLGKFREFLSWEIGKAVTELQTGAFEGDPEAILERVRKQSEYHDAVEAEWQALVDERQADEREFWAGVWPPTAPLEMEAMWRTLLLDMDELGADYFSDDPMVALAQFPIWDAWEEVNEALLTLQPDTVEAATAIARAAHRDWELGFDDWDAGKVAVAEALALPQLPRPF